MYSAPDTLVKYAAMALNENKTSGTKSNIFASVTEEVEKGQEGLLEDIDVQVEAANFILAGSDTTGLSLTFMVYNILLRPELQQAIEEEVANISDSPTDAEMEALPLLNATMIESMRTHGAIPSGLPRLVPPEGANFCGYQLPPGLTVTTQAYSLHRDPEAFPNPQK
jgi:cytochrome P450